VTGREGLRSGKAPSWRIDVLISVSDHRTLDHVLLDTVCHRSPRRRRIVRRYFLEPVDTVNAQHPGLFVDFEFVALSCGDFFSIKKPDHEHDAVLPSNAASPNPTVGPFASAVPLWDWHVNGSKTCNDNQLQAVADGEPTTRGPAESAVRPGAEAEHDVNVRLAKSAGDPAPGRLKGTFADGNARSFIG
jgi:hypothetical protein